MRTDAPVPGEPDTYRILSNGKGRLHLTDAVEGWLVPGRNPFGLYFYMQDVDLLAAKFRHERKGPKVMPRGMDEFSMSDPDETLVRVGWPSPTSQVYADSRVRSDHNVPGSSCRRGDRIIQSGRYCCSALVRLWQILLQKSENAA